MNCNSVDAKSAAIGATPVIITMTLGLLIVNVKKFRIPIASLFNSEAKCCQKDISIDEIEQIIRKENVRRDCDITIFLNYDNLKYIINIENIPITELPTNC